MPSWNLYDKELNQSGQSSAFFLLSFLSRRSGVPRARLDSAGKRLVGAGISAMVRAHILQFADDTVRLPP